MTPPPLKIYLLGTFAAESHGQVMAPLRLQKSQWLLALLALRQGRQVPRQWLAETLWPDNDNPLFNLRQVLSNDLRPQLGAAHSLLHATPKTLCLDASDVWVDVAAFDAAIKAGMLAELETAVALYRGPLLESCFEAWVLPERTVREEAFHDALERLAAEALAQKKPGMGVGHLRRLLVSDPLRESAHRLLLKALAVSGDTAGVKQAYQHLRQLLRDELNAEPDPETQVLYQRLQQPARQPSLPPAPTPSSPAPHRRLPVPLTPLIGREPDIATVVDHLRQGRLVTLVGAGGVGKTRLSIAVAEALAADFADGVWFVELDALTEAGLVSNRVAQALQVREQSGQTLIETLVSALSSRSLLLVLDNCEHLIDGCAGLVEHLLRWCEGVRVLATSREKLGLLGEWVYRVPSLAVPPRRLEGSGSVVEKNAASSLLEYDAVRLFVERATQQGLSWPVLVSHLSEVAAICRQLDGIPLAIEMASARVRSKSIAQIRSGLSDHFELSRLGSRTSLARHQTLHALIDWSYDLLTDPEKRLLGRLSIFAGGWTLSAAEQVCADFRVPILDFGWEPNATLPPGLEPKPNEIQDPKSKIQNGAMLDLLTSLVEQSLVVYEEWAGRGRYRLLETVRQYAAERLVASGESEAVRTMHRDYFLVLVEAAEPKLKGPEQVEWLKRLEEEHDNLRVALNWSLAKTGSGEGLQLCGALQRFWFMRGYLSEGQQWCEQALTKADAQARTSVRAKALNTAGLLALCQGDFPASIAYNEEAISIQKEVRDPHGIATSLYNLSRTPGVTLNHLEFERSVAIWLMTGDWHGIAASLCQLGCISFYWGDKAYGIPYLEWSLAINREVGDLHGIALTLNNLGHFAYSETKDYVAARAYFEESRDIRKKIGDMRGYAFATHNLGNLALHQNRPDVARAHFVESLNLLVKVGDKPNMAKCLAGFSSLATKEHQFERAAVLWGAVQAWQDKNEVGMTPREREEHEHEMAIMRKALGEEAFSGVLAKGRSMSLEQAIKLVLDNDAKNREGP